MALTWSSLVSIYARFFARHVAGGWLVSGKVLAFILLSLAQCAQDGCRRAAEPLTEVFVNAVVHPMVGENWVI